MTAPDLHSLSGAYAVDALDPAERAEFEQHLAWCEDCRREVSGLRATTARLAGATAVPPPPGLRDRVLDEVTRIAQVASRERAVAGPRAPHWWTRPSAVAAALLLVVSIGLGSAAVRQHQKAERAEARADRIAALVSDPEAVELETTTASGGRVTVVAAGGAALFSAVGLRPLPQDRTYQLWVVSGESAISAGLLGNGGRARALVDDLRDADALGVTVEPRSGSAAPTGDLEVLVDLRS